MANGTTGRPGSGDWRRRVPAAVAVVGLGAALVLGTAVVTLATELRRQAAAEAGQQAAPPGVAGVRLPGWSWIIPPARVR